MAILATINNSVWITPVLTKSTRAANILMVIAALALCVSACTGPGLTLPHTGLYSYNVPVAAPNVAAL